MLYFKTKKGRLIIQIPTDINEFVYMLICPPEDERVYGNYSFVNNNIWEKLRKISEPQVLDENAVDREAYDQAIQNEEISQQEIVDLEWQYQEALRAYK